MQELLPPVVFGVNFMHYCMMMIGSCLEQLFQLLALFYPGSGKTLLPGGPLLPPPPVFLAFGPPKAKNRTLAHFWH